MNGSLNMKGQQDIKNNFSCGLSLSCSSPMEDAQLLLAFRNNLKDDVCNQSSTSDKAAVITVNFDEEIKSNSPSKNQKYQLKHTSWAKKNEGSETKSLNLKRKGNDDLCRIQGADKPP